MTEVQELETLLEEEHNRSKDLDGTVQRLRSDADEATKLIQQSQYKEKDLTEKCREQVCLDFDFEHLYTNRLNRNGNCN
jgi:hypothetical protein